MVNDVVVQREGGMMAQDVTAQDHARGMEEYVRTGTDRALQLGNRGPIQFDSNGKLAQEILDAYWEHGFYVFTGLIEKDEIELLRRDFNRLIEGAPADEDSDVDALGRPAIGRQFKRNPYILIRPLSDPWGGTELLGGRHPIQMLQPVPEQEDAPAKVVFLIGGMCQLSDAALRLYGHPHLLSIAEGINGPDFVPYNDATFVKQPGLGGSVSWHQDGVTHWQSENWDEGIHGFNFQVQLYECTPYNGLWVMPGTHKLGRLDIKSLVAANGGSEQLPGAVPLLCQPGDVTIVNRQALHCSFANTSPNRRVSVTFGFHRRASVLGARGALSQSAGEVYDEARIYERASVIPVASDARARFYPAESRYRYGPFAGLEDQFRFTPQVWEEVIRDYNLKDLSI